MLKKLSEKNYDNEIKNVKGVCIVDFYATWCGPCMMLSPILEEVANSRCNYDILKVDVDENPNIANELKIDTIPTLCVYKDGELVEKKIGFLNKEEIIELFEKYK